MWRKNIYNEIIFFYFDLNGLILRSRIYTMRTLNKSIENEELKKSMKQSKFYSRNEIFHISIEMF